MRQPEIAEIFRRNRVNRVYLTGSFARKEQTAESDIDLIFEKPENVPFTLMNLGDMKSSLEAEFHRNVDLVSESSIHPRLKKYLEANKILIF